MSRVFAAADIGSNTAHLLVAATDGSLVMRLDNFNEWIPLGEVVAKTGEIPKENVQQLVQAVKTFRSIATSQKAEGLYLFATEAMRSARNHSAVIKKIHSETGVRVDIISSQQEADLSMRGVLLDTRNFGVDMMFEVGGGSAQIGQVKKNKLVHKISLPLGTGRIIAESGLRSPCPDYALTAAENYIDHVLDECGVDWSASIAVASGGVGRGLWRALHPDSEKIIALEEVEYIAWSCARLPLDRIVSRFSVKAKRAGTLLPGSLVYRALMKRFGLKEIVVSEFGIREGAVLEMSEGRVKSCLG